jgi:hypothetical protein
MQPNTIPLEQITGDLTKVLKGMVGARQNNPFFLSENACYPMNVFFNAVFHNTVTVTIFTGIDDDNYRG